MTLTSKQTIRNATQRVMENLALFGHTPASDEPDSRPLPSSDEVDAMVEAMFDGFTRPMEDTGLARELPDLLWSLTDLFHRKVERVQRQLDDNELKQRDLQAEQDGSEVQSVKLERMTDRGVHLLEMRGAFERFRDAAAGNFENYTGSAWRPRSGSMVNHRAKTAAVIDSRDYISAKRKAETDVHVPAGTKIVFAGGIDCNEVERIWAALDKARVRFPDLVLVHGASTKGAERIAACWADNRKVTQLTFKPDWVKDGKAAPFKRNDRMLDIIPQGVIAFSGSGITDNLVDKARGLGIQVMDCRKPGSPSR